MATTVIFDLKPSSHTEQTKKPSFREVMSNFSSNEFQTIGIYSGLAALMASRISKALHFNF